MKESMKGSKNSFRGQLWLSFGIIAAAIVAAAGSFYFLSNDGAAQADKIVADQNAIARQTGVLTILAALKKDAPAAVQYSDALGKLLPTHDSLIDFPQWLNALAQAHDVTISFSFQGSNNAATDAAPGSDGFSINATGEGGNLAAFLRDVETKAGFLVSIDNFDLSANGTQYRLSAQGKVFSR